MTAIVTYESYHGSAKTIAKTIAEKLGCRCINVDTPFEAEDPKMYDDLILVFNFRGPYTAVLTKLFLKRIGSMLETKNVYLIGEGLFSEKQFPMVASEIKQLINCRNFKTYFVKGQLRTDTLYSEEIALLEHFSEVSGMKIENIGELDLKAVETIGDEILRFVSNDVQYEEENAPKRWRCPFCGYVHDGEEPPNECPTCGASKDNFELM